MIRLTDLCGLLGMSLAVAALGAMALARLGLSSRRALFAAGLLMTALLLPFGALPAAGYLRGAVGDLSITSLVLLGEAAACRLGVRPAPDSRRRAALLAWVVLAAGALYPLALGAGAYDPYRLGYGDPWFLGLLLALALAAVAWRASLAALAIALAVSGWVVGVYESGNLWDYLIDPLLASYAVFAGLASLVAALRRRASA